MEDPTDEMLRRRQTDVAVASDIDWGAMRGLALAQSATWYDCRAQEGRPLDDDGLLTSAISREDYVARMDREYGPATLAICGDDGWREAPWTHEAPDGPTWRAWTSEWRGYVRSLPDDTLLVVVDCHE